MKKALSTFLAVLLILMAFVPSFVSASSLSVQFTVAFNRNSLAVATNVPSSETVVATAPVVGTSYTLADLQSNLKQTLYNASTTAHWAIVVAMPPSTTISFVEYDFTDTLENNLRGAYGSGYDSMYINGGVPGVELRLVSGAPNPAYDPNPSNLQKNLTLAFSTAAVGGVNNVPASMTIVVTRPSTASTAFWTIASNYLSSQQTAAMQAATKPGYTITWAFDNNTVYDYTKTLMQNVTAAYGTAAFNAIMNGVTPTITLHAVQTPVQQTLTFAVRFDNGGIALSPAAPSDQIVSVTGPLSDGTYSLGDLTAALKTQLYNTRTATSVAQRVRWVIVYSDGTNERVDGEYDFTKSLETNLRAALTSTEYNNMYLRGTTTSGVALRAYVGNPNPSYDPDGGSQPTQKSFTLTFSAGIGGVSNIPASMTIVATRAQAGANWTIAATYLTAQQTASMQAASKTGYDITWAFDSNNTAYAYNSTLLQNILNAIGQTAFNNLMNGSAVPSIALHAVQTPIVNPVGKAQLTGSHINSTTIRLTEEPTQGASVYNLTMATIANGVYSTIATLTGSNLSFDKQNLQTGDYYYFQSTPFASLNGTQGTPSEILMVRARPQRPGSISAAARSRSVLLQWAKVQDCNGYAVYISNSRNGQYSLVTTVSGNNSLSYTVKNLSRQPYYFKVVSYKQVGNYKVPSVFTGVVTATPY